MIKSAPVPAMDHLTRVLPAISLEHPPLFSIAMLDFVYGIVNRGSGIIGWRILVP
jgi:hypothetical protein